MANSFCLNRVDYYLHVMDRVDTKIADMARVIDKEERLQKCFDDPAWLENKKKNNNSGISASALDCRKLKIIRSIGEGVYGSVYQGIYNDKQVAVKVFHMAEISERTRLRRSFLQEVSVLKDLHHPNIIKFLGVMNNMLEVNIDVKESQAFDTTQDCCLVTEFIPRGTLEQYLNKHYPNMLPISTVIQLALDIAKGLSYLHSKKIMHRDVKTENMLIDKNGRVKIIDFGLSGVAELTKPARIGTLGYMAPEVHARSSYDHKCDVYSFGICLSEIYCCSFPYDVSVIEDKIYCPSFYKNLRPNIPDSCPSALVDLMKQCWDTDPKKRPEMTSVVQMLQKFEESTLDEATKKLSWLCVR